jgi:tetrahydromethanopterin S-methyltransferase subunit B
LIGLRTAVSYVAAVYVIALVVFFVYTALIAAKIRRLEAAVAALERDLKPRDTPSESPPVAVE